jgi:hypothetical protein
MVAAEAIMGGAEAITAAVEAITAAAEAIMAAAEAMVGAEVMVAAEDAGAAEGAAAAEAAEGAAWEVAVCGLQVFESAPSPAASLGPFPLVQPMPLMAQRPDARYTRPPLATRPVRAAHMTDTIPTTKTLSGTSASVWPMCRVASLSCWAHDQTDSDFDGGSAI